MCKGLVFRIWDLGFRVLVIRNFRAKLFGSCVLFSARFPRV